MRDKEEILKQFIHYLLFHQTPLLLQRQKFSTMMTPLIPIIEVDNEELDASIVENPKNILDTPSSGSQPNSLNLGNHQESTKGSSRQTVENPLTKNSILKISVAEPDVEAAASAAYTAIRVISAEGSLIDRELLVKILSKPKVIEKLAAECAVPKQATPPTPSMLSTSAVPAVPSSTEVLVLPFSSGARASTLSPSNEVGPAKLLHVPIQQSPTYSHSTPSVVAHFKPQVSCASMHQTAKTVAETPLKNLSSSYIAPLQPTLIRAQTLLLVTRSDLSACECHPFDLNI